MTGADAHSGRAPLLLCVDVEPDDHQIRRDGTSRWSGFPMLADELCSMRQRLNDLTGQPVHFTWSVRMDPQIAESYGDAAHIVQKEEARFSAFLEAGDEIAVHPHAWQWHEESGTWLAAHGDRQWVEHCVENSLDVYQKTFGQPCRSHRFGDRFFSEDILAVLERRGVLYDLTSEPGEPPMPSGQPPPTLYSGSLPDFRNVPRQPYYPAPDEFQRAGPSRPGGVRIVPLTSIDAPTLRRRLGRLKRRERGPFHRSHVMWLAGGDAERYWSVAQKYLAKAPVPYLAFAMRSDCLVTDWVAASVSPILRLLPTHPIVSKVRFVTPTEWLGVS